MVIKAIIIISPTLDSSARYRNLLCVFHVILKLSGCQGLTWPSNVTGLHDKDCPTTSTSSDGSEKSHSPRTDCGEGPPWRSFLSCATSERFLACLDSHDKFSLRGGKRHVVLVPTLLLVGQFLLVRLAQLTLGSSTQLLPHQRQLARRYCGQKWRRYTVAS